MGGESQNVFTQPYKTTFLFASGINLPSNELKVSITSHWMQNLELNALVAENTLK